MSIPERTEKYYLNGIRARQRGDYHQALAFFYAERDRCLYRLMWSLEDIRPLQDAIMGCYKDMRS